MSADELSKETIEFLQKNFGSVEQLELLLLLRNDPERSFSVKELSAVVRSHEDSVASRMTILTRMGVVHKTGDTFHYSRKDPEMERLVALISEAYIVRRYTVIGLIYSGENDGLQSFSQAFNLGKGKKKDG